MKRPASAMDASGFAVTRVACLGDSNTVGGGLRSESYPAQLQRRLDQEAGPGAFLVKSFGVNGAVAAKTPGKKCYMEQTRYTAATDFQAHVHVVMLGTNDAWHRNGEPKKVAEAIASLVADLRRRHGVAKSVVIVQPPGVKAGRLSDNLTQHVHPQLRQRVRSMASSILLELPPSLSDARGYKADLVHLSEKGASEIAACVASAILGEKRADSAETGCPLRWLFFGCGAVGGYFGARLAEKGEKVSFMVRKDTLRVLKSEGVKVKSICGDVHIPRAKLDQVMNTEALDKESKFEADVIVLGCKAWEVERCLGMCAPWCGKNTLVLPLQNGVDGAGKVRQMVSGWGRGHPLVGWCNIVAAIQEPGLIKHWAANPPAVYFGEFEGEATAKTKQLETIFSKCDGVAVHLEQDALCACWEKFSFICSTTAVQATAGPSATQDLIPKVPELEQMWRSAMREIMAVARAHGVNYKEEWIDKRIPILAEALGATTSCSRDLWAGRHSELDDLLGSVHRLGEAKNVPTPVISTCYRSLAVRDRVARREATLPIYPLLEGQKILGTICNHKGQQLPAERTLVQKKVSEASALAASVEKASECEKHFCTDESKLEWFICPMTSAVASGGQSEIPEGVQMMWEAELGVVISHACENLSVEEAMNYVGGYCVVLDLTGGNLGAWGRCNVEQRGTTWNNVEQRGTTWNNVEQRGTTWDDWGRQFRKVLGEREITGSTLAGELCKLSITV
ncbi:unnamed protein product [Cladocopium goreaui]|uniref:2-dehydropantoate 2-reductase n=1 Tax=Cladocopium goreaui TaxID=2562237 RepID=A0A9P1DHQ5_9DINO|nr:unnamed protein product [Cladocopium goreaui]